MIRASVPQGRVAWLSQALRATICSAQILGKKRTRFAQTTFLLIPKSSALRGCDRRRHPALEHTGAASGFGFAPLRLLHFEQVAQGQADEEQGEQRD